MPDVIIIGGGVAGLTATIHLAERGLQPLLLEANPDWIGGRLCDGPPTQFEHGGRRWSFPSEHGVHGIWSPYLNLKAMLERHRIMPALRASREETWIFGRGAKVRIAPIGSAIRGSPIPAPFHYLYCFLRPSFLNVLTVRDLASLFRVVGGLFGAMAIDPLAEHKALTGMSLADYMRGWSPTLRSLFVGLMRNGLSAHPEEVPVSGFLAFLRFYSVMRRDSWVFDYLSGPGGTCIAAPLAETACQLGAEIRMGARVTDLSRRGDRWHVTYADHATGATCTVSADQTIVALDAPAAQKLLASSAATSDQATHLRFPNGVPTAIIRIWFARHPQPIAESGIYSGDFVMDNFFWLDQIQDAYREWSAATGGSALEMHIYGQPETLNQPDAALLALVLNDTCRAFPELRGQVLNMALLRNGATHTLFRIGEPDEHLGVGTPWPNLFACGDWVYHPAPALYLERATVTGIAAANAALAGRGMEPWPLLAYPRPEWFAGLLAGMFRQVRYALLRRKRARM
ncbi:MAG TPA: FAD-dependent oxidoreductase [Roseiflexaceae bacterium]